MGSVRETFTNLMHDVTVAGEGSDCQIYNVLDVPGGVVPVTTVTADDIIGMADYPDVNEAYSDIKKAGFSIFSCRQFAN